MEKAVACRFDASPSGLTAISLSIARLLHAKTTLMGSLQRLSKGHVGVDVGFDGLRGLTVKPVANLLGCDHVARLSLAHNLLGNAVKTLVVFHPF